MTLPASGGVPDPSFTSTSTRPGDRSCEQRTEPAVVDDGLRSDLVEQCSNLVGVVVVIDVEWDCASAVGADHRLEVLRAIREHNCDRTLAAFPASELGTLVVHAEPGVAEERGESLRAFLHLGEAAPH